MLYGHHLLQSRNRGVRHIYCWYGLLVQTAVRSGFYLAQFPRRSTAWYCWFGTEKEKGCWLFCWALFFQTLWRSLPVEISCIFTIFFCPVHCWRIIKISPLSDWFSPWGFFQGWLAKNLSVNFYGVHAFVFSLLINFYCVFKIVRQNFK